MRQRSPSSPTGSRRPSGIDPVGQLVAHFLQIIAREAGQERKVYAPEAVEMLVTAEWPGNIRQLYNIVRQNVALSRSPVISAELVQQSLGEHSGKLLSFSDARDEFTDSWGRHRLGTGCGTEFVLPGEQDV